MILFFFVSLASKPFHSPLGLHTFPPSLFSFISFGEHRLAHLSTSAGTNISLRAAPFHPPPPPPSCLILLSPSLVPPFYHPDTWLERRYESNLGWDPEQNRPSLLQQAHACIHSCDEKIFWGAKLLLLTPTKSKVLYKCHYRFGALTIQLFMRHHVNWLTVLLPLLWQKQPLLSQR